MISAVKPTQDEDSCYCSDQWLACEPGQVTAGSTTWHLSSACAWQEHSVGEEETLLERAVRGKRRGPHHLSQLQGWMRCCSSSDSGSTRSRERAPSRNPGTSESPFEA